MMKRSIGLIALFMVAMAFVVAPVAAEKTATTAVDIINCGGVAPVIKCKWENDTSEWMEDGDTTHDIFGSQFDPTCDDELTKEIFVYAVVTDEQGYDTISNVRFNVEGPCGEELIADTCMSKVTTGALDLLNAANLTDLISYYNDYDLADVRTELGNCPTAMLYCGSFEIGYCSPAGEYTVAIVAEDDSFQSSDIVENVFTMNRAACCEYDFTEINWGTITNDNSEAIVPGDENMDTSWYPTVNNLGNIAINIKVRQEFLKNGAGDQVYLNNCGEKMYRFDANILSSTKKYFAPSDSAFTTLNGVIERCEMDGICFSLDQLNGGLPPGAYSGVVHIQCVDSGIIEECTPL